GLNRADWPAINALLAEMEAEGRAVLARAGIDASDVTVSRIAEMRYVGQGHEVEAVLPPGELSDADVSAITGNFEAAYRALYHRLPQGVALEALNWRVTVSGPRPAMTFAPPSAERDPSAAEALKGYRAAWFTEARGFVETPVYDRYRLGPGAVFSGPAIV